MTLRAKILSYLVLIHLLLGAIAVLALWEHRPWLLVAEAVFAASIGVGWILVRRFFVPLELIRTGAELLRERDFTVHFREVGQPEMDDLIAIYNRMVDQLRDERQRLAEQHVLLDKVLRAAPAGMLTLDFDGRITLANPAAERLLGYRAGALVGLPLDGADTPVARELATLAPGESRILALTGGRRVRARRTAFLDRGFERSFLLIEELTDELRESERSAYGKVIRLMSHEVKNSVGAVRSLLESCRDFGAQLAQADRGEFARALEVAAGRLENLDGFINGFADVVRLPDPEPRPCDLTGLVADVLVLLEPELARRGIRAACEAPGGGPVVVAADKNQMEQVLLNVLQNAMESIGEGGRIAVRIGREAGGVRLTVVDDGAGIPAEVRPRLFTPFFSTKRDGRGLGLTVIQEILARHGFAFQLEARAEGGAEFRVDIPGRLGS
jgi:nitrogen fixation/metabolism regulation signal transduction histidine kinase